MREWDCLTTKNLLARSRMRAEATKKILVPLPGLKFWFDSREVDFTCKSWSLAPQNRTFFPRSSKFDFGVSFESEPGQCDMASGPSKFDLWRTFQSEPGQCEMVSRPSKFDFWWGFQSEPEQRDVASRLANFNRWSEFRSESWQCGMASRLANFNFWSEFRSGSWQRGIWFVVSKNVQLIVDSFHDSDSLCPHAGTSQETVYSPGSLPHAGRGYQKNTGPSPGLEILIRLARSRFHLQIMVVGASKSNFLSKAFKVWLLSLFLQKTWKWYGQKAFRVCPSSTLSLWERTKMTMTQVWTGKLCSGQCGPGGQGGLEPYVNWFLAILL